MKHFLKIKQGGNHQSYFPVAISAPLSSRHQGQLEGILPVMDKPLIQYAVEEESAATGITDMIFVTERSIDYHFYKAYKLENELERRWQKNVAHAFAAML